MLVFVDTLIAFAALMLGISLLITVLNQAASTLFAHRGANLNWGLQVLFREIDPRLPALKLLSNTLAEAVLTHPLASDSTLSTSKTLTGLARSFPRLFRFVKRWQFANAIQPQDLAAVLRHIADNRPPQIGIVWHTVLADDIRRLLGTQSPDASREVALAQSLAVAITPQLRASTIQNSSVTPGNLESWFNKINERVSQRFTTWMRVWTIFFSFVIAFGFCIDTLKILPELHDNDSLRTQLAGTASSIQNAGRSILALSGTGQAQRADAEASNIYTQALSDALTKNKLTPTTGQTFASPADVATWIGDPSHVPVTQQSVVRSDFDSATSTALNQRLQAAGQIYSVLSTSLPKFGPSDWKQEGALRQIAGVLITAMLLSLGAPFWYNTLSSLSSLKPQLAVNQTTTQKPTN